MAVKDSLVNVVWMKDWRRWMQSFFILTCLLWMSLPAYSTHIRAGEITIHRIDALTYEFKFTGYRDSGSSILFGGGVFNFGDGNSISRDFQVVYTPAGNNIEKAEFIVRHRYAAGGRYLVSYKEDFRNDGIINMDNSVGTAFYVESYFEIDPFINVNSYPILTVPPIDFAAVGAFFIHNPGAVDNDGDSLAYRFVVPKQDRNLEVNNYRVMNHPSFYSNFPTGSEEGTPPTLTLDPIEGDLVWNAPGDARGSTGDREYNVAFRIEEWRRTEIGWIMISYVTRDMQIIVEETDNERPELMLPDDICVVAGDTVNVIVQGTDPDGHQIMLEAFGGPFETNSPAVYAPNPPVFQDSPGFLTFDWATVCGHVRMRPYEVQFKVTDQPEMGPKLVNFETLEITVVGPAPTGLETTVLPGRTMQLNWDPYSCPNADSIQVWRRVGSFDIPEDECTVGMPANTGYELVARLPIGTNTFVDNNRGRGLAAGANYCYRLVAQFPQPGGGLSLVSSEACDSLIADAPVITHVDVETTSETAGQIMVRWAPAMQVDSASFPPTYRYVLLRTEGMEGAGPYIPVTGQRQETFYMDTLLNTRNMAYSYRVVLFDNTGNVVDTSAAASSVRLGLRPLFQAIELTWEANVPWSNRIQDYPYHYIYRDQVLESNSSQLVLIDSVEVTGGPFSYLDEGSFNDVPLHEEIEYCYFVTTFGSYDNTLLPEPLINRSQISCAQPNDTIPPCPSTNVVIVNAPDCQSIIAGKPCNSNTYENVLTWTDPTTTECGEDLVGYQVHYSPTGNSNDYTMIGTTTRTEFVHGNLPSLKGCYKIRAVDRSGNVSADSEEICNDNCPVYRLPNVFTPNGDGVNDVFGPFNDNISNLTGFDYTTCPRFVKRVQFRVFDRTGSELYTYDSFESENGIFINWDGKTNLAQELPSGVYYYVAELELDVLERTTPTETVKGWVQILK